MSHRKIIKDIRRRKIPFQAMIIVTWQCNFRCEYCYPFLPLDNAPSLSEIKRKIDKIACEGNMQLFINGGEPLIRKDFLEIVRYAGEKPLAVVIQTNGTLMTPEIADRLKELNVMQVELNLLAAERNLHDSITGIKGSFAKTLSVAKFLKNKGIRVVFNTVLIKKNQGQILRLKRLSKKINIPQCFRPVDYPDEGRKPIARSTYLRRYKVDKPMSFYWR